MIEKSITLSLYLSVLNHVLILFLLSSLIYDSKETISLEPHRTGTVKEILYVQSCAQPQQSEYTAGTAGNTQA